MSGLELPGFVLGVLGALEQSIKVAKIFRNHCKSFNGNETVIQELITFLSHLQHDLNQLQPQLQQHQSSIPQSNYKIIETQFLQMKAKFEEAQTSLTKMNQSAGRNLKHFFKASKWSDNCQHILTQLQETQKCLLLINIFLGSNEVSKQNIDNATRKIIQTVQAHAAPSSSTQSTDRFQPHSQKLSISYGAIPDFESTDSQGNPSTIEGKLKQRLLGTNTHTKIFSVIGPGGVGKTTTIHMLTYDLQLRQYFHHGVYYIKLGANAKIESVIDSLADIVRKSGGVLKASEVQACESVEKAIEICSTWLMNKKYLVLLDDVWEQNGLGEILLLSLKCMICASDEGGMSFTTRDPCIATQALEAFRLDYRKPQGIESRTILFQHARQKPQRMYGEETEKYIRKLLETCGGLPVAHSVAGKGVFELSIRRDVSDQDAWRKYYRRQQDVLVGKPDEYPTLHNVFTTAISLLEEDSVENKKRKRDACTINYKDIQRSFCVLEKQQLAPIDTLGCLWNVESEDETRQICKNLVRVGLAEWRDLHVKDMRGTVLDVECVSIHDLIHDFATEEAKREDEIETWHRRIVSGCAMKMRMSDSAVHGCRKWWKVGEQEESRDGGYLIRNICRHLCHGASEENEVVTLVTRPEWIRLQLCKNGLLQYERDVEHGMRWMQMRRRNAIRNGEMGMKEVKMIRDAARLSSSHIWKNMNEIWFQLYGRLMKWGKSSETMKNYLKYFEENVDGPWLRLIENSEGMLTSVGSRIRSVIDVRHVMNIATHEKEKMVVLPGGEEVLCGCDDELVVVNLKSNIVKKCWRVQEHLHGRFRPVFKLLILEQQNIVLSVTDRSCKMWEIGSWRLLNTMANKLGKIETIAMNEDERVFACTTLDGCICLWNITNINSPQRVLTLTIANGYHVFEMIVLKNRIEIIIVNNNWQLPNYDIYTIENANFEEEECQEIQPKDQHRRKPWIICGSRIQCMDVSRDESKMITAHCDKSLQLWDISTMTPINAPWAVEYVVTCVSFNKDSTKIVCGDRHGTIHVRNVNTGVSISGRLTRPIGVIEAKFTDVDNTIVALSEYGKVVLWNVDESIGDAAEEHVSNVRWVTCSADESYFVTAHADGRLIVWNAASGQLIRESAQSETCFKCVAVTANGLWIIAVGGDKMVKMIDWERLELRHNWKGHTRDISSVEISNNQEFAVTTSVDKTIRVWDLIKCDGTHKIITSICKYDRCFVSDDDKRIIAIDDDHNWEVQDIETGQLLRTKGHQYKSSREETLCTVGETCAQGEENKMFVRFERGVSPAREIRYGTALSSIVLGTIVIYDMNMYEANVNSFAYSSRQKMVALLCENHLKLLKLHV